MDRPPVGRIRGAGTVPGPGLFPMAVPLPGLSCFLTPLQMQGTGGFTETFSAIQLPPADLRSIVEDEGSRLNLG